MTAEKQYATGGVVRKDSDPFWMHPEVIECSMGMIPSGNLSRTRELLAEIAEKLMGGDLDGNHSAGCLDCEISVCPG